MLFHFIFPFQGDRITKICNTTVEVECIEKVEDELYSTSDTAKSKLLSYCQCLPACTILKYEIEIAKTRFKSHDLLATAASSLKVFFKANDFVPLRRFQLYGIVDFLANCGLYSIFDYYSETVVESAEKKTSDEIDFSNH